jgi:hypothetical protein
MCLPKRVTIMAAEFMVKLHFEGYFNQQTCWEMSHEIPTTKWMMILKLISRKGG